VDKLKETQRTSY